MRYLQGKINRSNTKDKMYTIMIALFPFLYLMSGLVGDVLLSEVLIMLTAPIVLLSRWETISSTYKYWLLSFFVYAVITFLIGKIAFDNSYTVGSGYVGIIVLGITFVVHLQYGMSHFDITLARRIIETITIIACIGLLLQYAVYYATGSYTQFVPYSIYRETVRIEYMESFRIDRVMGIYRPSSIFLEPSGFSQYCVIGLVSILIDNVKRKKLVRYLLALFISICILMTTSGIGFVCVITIWVLYLFSDVKRGRATNIIRFIVGIIGLVVAYFALRNTSYVGTIIERIISGDALLRGISYEYWTQLPFLQVIFGVGYGLEPSVYFTGFAHTLYCFGIVGTLLFIAPMASQFKHINKRGKYLLTIWILLFITCGISNMSLIMFYWVLILSNIDESSVITNIDVINIESRQ